MQKIQYYGNLAILTTNNKIKRAAVKELLLSIYKNEYNIEALEKTFRSLRTCMSREIKKENEGNASKKKWKFYDQLEFLRDELNLATSLKKRSFEVADVETIIDYYECNEALWNHNLAEYRERDLRDALLERLVDDLDDRYTKDEIKRHNLMTTYKRERQRQEASKTSGTGKDDMYVSNWEYFKSMFFWKTLVTPMNRSTLWMRSACHQLKKKVITASTAEQSAKAELWKASH